MSESVAEHADLPLAAKASGRRLTVALYGAAVFLYWAALYLYVPTLPTYAESRTDSLAVVGVILAQYGLWQGVVRLPLGIAADWLGWRKPFIIVGFALAGAGALTMGLTHSVNGLLVGRAITGLAAGTWVPLIVAFSSLFPPEESVRASALITLIGSVGRALATGVTGSLNELGGHSLAFLLAAAAAALAMLAVLPIREKQRPLQRPSVAAIGGLVSRRDVLLPALLAAVSQYANWAATFSFVPILADQLGATDVAKSAMLSANIGMILLGNLVATSIVNRVGARHLVRFSFVLLSLGLGGAALAPTLPVLIVSQLCIGLSQGTGYPVLMGMSIRQVSDSSRATAMGLHQAVYAIGMFSGPWVSGIVADLVGIQPMFGLTAPVCLALGLSGIPWLGRRQDPQRGAAARASVRGSAAPETGAILPED